MMAQKLYSFSETEGNTARDSERYPASPHSTTPREDYLKLVVDDAVRLRQEKPLTWLGMGISGLSHVAVVALLILAFLLVDMLNWRFSLFELPELELNRPTEIEYVIVQNRKPEPPRNPKTTNRAEVASRSGGPKTKKSVQSEAQQAAGGKPSVARQAQQQGGGQPTPETRNAPVVAPRQNTTPAGAAPKSQPAPKARASQPAAVTQPASANKAQSPSTTAKKQAQTAPKTIGVAKPTGSKPVGGSTAPKQESENNNIAWDAPDPIVSSPTTGGSGGGSGSSASASGGSAKRVSTGAGNGTSNQPASAANVKGSGGSGALNSSASGGGGGGLAGVDALPEPDMSPYINNVNSRIRRNWVRPESSPAGSVASFKLRISRSGALLSSSLTRSSGDPLFDSKAKAAIQAGAPFGAVPAAFRGSSVDIDFTFTVNGASGR